MLASEPRPEVADARHLARKLSVRVVDILYDIMTDRSASIASQLAAAQGILSVTQLMESAVATAMPT